MNKFIIILVILYLVQTGLLAPTIEDHLEDQNHENEFDSNSNEERFNDCELNGRRSVSSDDQNWNCQTITGFGFKNFNAKDTEHCTKRFIQGCHDEKAKEYCQRGAEHFLSGQAKECQPLTYKFREKGMDYYSRCCEICWESWKYYSEHNTCEMKSLNLDQIQKTIWNNCCHHFKSQAIEIENTASSLCSKLNCAHECDDQMSICMCRDGYRLNDDKRTCDDLDECELGIHECNSNQLCINLQGNHKCIESDSSKPNTRTVPSQSQKVKSDANSWFVHSSIIALVVIGLIYNLQNKF